MSPTLRWAPGDRCAWNGDVWIVAEVHPIAGVAYVAHPIQLPDAPLTWLAPIAELELVPFAKVAP